MTGIFSKEEVIWIVINYRHLGGPSETRRKFISHFGVSLARKKKLTDRQFSRAFFRFQSDGTLSTYEKRQAKSCTATGDAMAEEVKNHFERKPKSSVRVCK
jgi:hypothetical protein